MDFNLLAFLLQLAQISSNGVKGLARLVSHAKDRSSLTSNAEQRLAVLEEITPNLDSLAPGFGTGFAAQAEVLSGIKKTLSDLNSSQRLPAIQWLMRIRAILVENEHHQHMTESSITLAITLFMLSTALPKIREQNDEIMRLVERSQLPCENVPPINDSKSSLVHLQKSNSSKINDPARIRPASSHKAQFDTTWLGWLIRFATTGEERYEIYSILQLRFLRVLLVFRLAVLWTKFGLKVKVPQMLSLSQMKIPRNHEVFLAIKKRDETALERILSTGQVRANYCDPDGNTLMSFTVSEGSETLTGLLLRYKADPNLTYGSDQECPLDIAFFKHRPDICRLLFANGATMENFNSDGWIPLFYSWHHGVSSALRMFPLAQGMEPELWNVADTAGWTIGHKTALHDTYEGIKYLFERCPIDTNAEIKEVGWRAIHVAAAYRNLGTFRFLCEYQNPAEHEWFTDRRGWSILHIAVASGCREIIAELLVMATQHESRLAARGPEVLDRLQDRLTDWCDHQSLPEALQRRRSSVMDVAVYSGHGEIYQGALQDATNRINARM